MYEEKAEEREKGNNIGERKEKGEGGKKEEKKEGK